MTQSSESPSAIWGKQWQWFASSLTLHDRFLDYAEPLIQLLLPAWHVDTPRARVLEVRTETTDVYTLVLRPGFTWKGFCAGQYIELNVEKDGARTLRCFSISSSPEHFSRTGLIELTIREQDGGAITPWLREQFAQGGWVNLSQAKGEFLWPEGNRPILMIAGGSGITPFRSMLQEAASRGVERNVHLMYYARNNQSWLFNDEFQRLMLDFPGLTVSLMDSESQGFINKEQLHDFCPDYINREVMICGPGPMIKMARTICEESGVPNSHIHYEYFGAAPVDMPEATAADAVVSFDRSGVTITASREQPDSLLSLAEQQGLKPVSGCRIGVCHQCICKKKSGVVFNTRTGRYSDTGPGEIQLCVSVATSDLVIDL